MTYILGIRGQDGVVLVADRKIIFHNFNVEYRNKLFVDFYPFVMGSSGSVSLFDKFRNRALKAANELISSEQDTSVEKYISEIERITEQLNSRYAHNQPAFDDPQETIKEYNSHVNIHFAIAGKQKTSQEKEIDYQRNLSKMETMLQSYHEELEMVKHNNVSKKKISYDPKKVFIVY